MGYLNLVGSFVYKEPVFRSKLDALAENDAQLKTDGWAQSTKTLFYQSAVPLGWTQDVSQNDKLIRLVGSIGGGGSGGSQALSSTISLQHSHTLADPDDGAHTHAFSNHTHNGGVATTNLRVGSNFIGDVSGFMRYYAAGGLGFASQIKSILASPGAITLGTEPDHNHGAPSTELTDFVFAYCDVIVGTKNAPSGTYTDLTAYWHTGDKVDFDPFDAYADNDAYNLGNLMPSGTVMVFGQASAPSGWTKIATTNDRMLRIVSGAGGGTGGTQLASSGVTLTHTHTLAAVADHTHSVPAHIHNNDTGGSVAATLANPSEFSFVVDSLVSPGFMSPAKQDGSLFGTGIARLSMKTSTTSSGNGSTSAAGGHTHTLPTALADFTMAYVDVIQCSKDSAGSPYAYTDYTSEFAWKKLVTWQRLDTLARNDGYIEFHTTPFASQALFFMASPPAGWVKITTQHDKALRIVSGGTGGSPGGGSHLASDLIPLAHTHAVNAQLDHSHTAYHTHPIATGSQIVVIPEGFLRASASIIHNAIGGGTSPSDILMSTTTALNTEVPAAAGEHSHGGITNSQLSDVQLAYADVIWCTKS